MNKKILSGILAAILAVSCLASCGSGDDSDTSSSGDSDTLVYAQGADPRGLDPQIVDDGESAKVTNQIYEGLLQYEDDSTEVKACLAKDWEISDDGLVYTFYLQEGVKFHDGTDFNAEAVKYNVERNTINKTEDMTYADFVWGYVSGVEVVDEYTVNITLSQPSTPFLANLAMVFGAPMVSPTAAEEGDLMNEPVGTGPYKFVEWKKDQYVKLEANEDYWNEDGKAQITNVVIRTIEDASTKILELQSGDVDIIDGIDTNQVASLESDSNITVNTTPGMNINYMAYNAERLDKETRVALSQSVNVEELVAGLYNGYAEVATTILPTFVPGYSADVTQIAYDPDAAKATLEEKGVTSLHVITYTNARPYNTATGQTLTEAIQGYFSEVGVEVEIDSYDWTTYKDKAIAGDYDICFYGWSGDNGDPDNFLNLLSDTNAGMNVARFNLAANEDDQEAYTAYAEMISEAAQEPTGDSRNAMYAEMEQYVADLALWLPISHQQDITACKANVQNFQYHCTATVKLYKVTKS
ncbi:MAG: ABC transporter substrate-binding protein [Ruminococcus sp.]|nr:ABC transporter substrate-binding protein [Ruminococcus sp.]